MNRKDLQGTIPIKDDNARKQMGEKNINGKVNGVSGGDVYSVEYADYFYHQVLDAHWGVLYEEDFRVGYNPTLYPCSSIFSRSAELGDLGHIPKRLQRAEDLSFNPGLSGSISTRLGDLKKLTILSDPIEAHHQES
ncbi:hypothetical protein OROMI_018570 [Orobanche minor]